MKISLLLDRLLDLSRPAKGASLQPRPAAIDPVIDAESMGLLTRSDPVGRRALETLLMQRVGELSCHLGRYDMYALTIATWLEEKGSAVLPSEPLTIRNRGASIVSQLRLFTAPDSTIAEYEDINRLLLSVFARQDIAAKKKASIASLREFSVLQVLPVNAERDWYDFIGAPDRQLQDFIDSMERDITLVASLYIRLAGWAGGLAMLPR